ncbi:MAG TPA: TlpA disulfide reductase family protein [Nitrospira sp.]|jgi:cytochrome c biogenesis protein CcmG/thiol:disulfide interchange protein DsbE|nr:TlpA disulfide reductase family protein [Nitrospira sp.]
MKRVLIALTMALVPLWAYHVAFAAGFFKVGEPAPAFTLTSITGDVVSLEQLRGRVVVLGLFHICDPCMMQGTNLQKVYEAMAGKNIAVVGINSSGNSKRDVGEFLSAFPVKVTYPYLLDPSKTTDKLYGGGKFIPNVYVIDQRGVIRWQRVGNMELAGADVIIQEVEKLLASAPMGGAGAM